MYLIVFVVLATAFIIFATARLDLYPFLALSVTACGFGVLFGMQLLGLLLLSLHLP